jgi:hypothetical protein
MASNQDNLGEIQMTKQLNEDEIGQYYARIERARAEAWRKVRDARERGADPREIMKLEEAALEAGYTGD